MKDELTDGHQKAEFLRAKQDMVNRIIQMEEKVLEFGKDKSKKIIYSLSVGRKVCFDLRYVLA